MEHISAIGHYPWILSQIIDLENKRPVFIGQIKDDWYSEELRKAFPDAMFLNNGSVLGDFETIRAAKHTVLAISSFSWMAAWLSEAETIHYPLSGIFDPILYEHVDLLPVGDPRYRYYSFPQREWRVTRKQKADLFRPFELRQLNRFEIQDISNLSRQNWARS